MRRARLSTKLRRFEAVLVLLWAAACVEPPTVVVQPLRVINWAPASGAICVDPNAEVLVTFSDDLALDSLNAESLFVASSDGPLAATQGYDKPTFTARLTLAAPLDFGRLYTITARRAIEGGEQGPLPVDLSSSFQTVRRTGCTPGPECQLASDCATGQLCSSIGTCIDECVTERDCPGNVACVAGTCQ